MRQAKLSLLAFGARSLRRDCRFKQLVKALATGLFESKLLLNVLRSRSANGSPDEATASTATHAEQSSTYQGGHHYYPADEIAAVSRCISVLQNFKDTVSNGYYDSHNKDYNHRIVYSHQEYYGRCEQNSPAHHPQHYFQPHHQQPPGANQSQFFFEQPSTPTMNFHKRR